MLELTLNGLQRSGLISTGGKVTTVKKRLVEEQDIQELDVLISVYGGSESILPYVGADEIEVTPQMV